MSEEQVFIHTVIKNRLPQLFKHLGTNASPTSPLVGYLIGNKINHKYYILNFMKYLSKDEFDIFTKVMIPKGLEIIGIYTTLNSISNENIKEELPTFLSNNFPHLLSFNNDILILIGNDLQLLKYKNKQIIEMNNIKELNDIKIIGDLTDLNKQQKDEDLSFLIGRTNLTIKLSTNNNLNNMKEEIDLWLNQLNNNSSILFKYQNKIVNFDENLTEILPKQLNNENDYSFLQPSASTVGGDWNGKAKKKKNLPKQTLGEFLKQQQGSMSSTSSNNNSLKMNDANKILTFEMFVQSFNSNQNGSTITINNENHNQLVLYLDSIAYSSNKNNELLKLLINGIKDQLEYIKKYLLTTTNKEIRFYSFLPKDYLHIFTCCYPFHNNENILLEQTENYLIKIREEYHKRLYFSLKQSFIRINQALVFNNNLNKKYKKLLNVHLYVGYPTTIKRNNNDNSIKSLHLIKGDYLYSHYCQDKFDDSGWGCAYRSLQTLISHAQFYFNLNHLNLPTHEEIQKCLVECGDKKKSFINSTQWIGAFENSLVMEKWCGVQCKVLYVNSGEEMNSYARQIANHFDTNGSPIMIGGGVLAYTMLGIDFDEMTGEVSYLILDPHFTGSINSDDYLEDIISGGWCSWKTREQVFKNGVFYNLCMPQLTLNSV